MDKAKAGQANGQPVESACRDCTQRHSCRRIYIDVHEVTISHRTDLRGILAGSDRTAIARET
jgi:hypothetical protein